MPKFSRKLVRKIGEENKSIEISAQQKRTTQTICCGLYLVGGPPVTPEL